MMASGWSKKDTSKMSLHESFVSCSSTGEYPTSILMNKTDKNACFSWKKPSELNKELRGRVRIRSIIVDQLVCSTSYTFLEQSNRIIQRYGSDHFLLVNFSKKVESTVVRKVLNGGVFINEEEFHFIGCSSGGLKSRTCYMFKGSQNDIKQIWTECGKFSAIKSRYKRLKRIGLLFSSAIPTGIKIPLSAVIEIPDIETVNHNFTDGCGLISLDLAKMLATNSKMPDNYIPSAFQIRYQGCKGVVAVDNTLKESNLVMRPSMKKFNSGTRPFDELWLCSYSRPYTFGYLNRQFITLLHSLGVKCEVFRSIQNEHFQRLKNVSNDIRAAFEMLLFDNQIDMAMNCTCPEFLKSHRSELTKIKSKALAKLEKLRLPILKSRNVFGVCDTTATLQYGQCYIRVMDKGLSKTVSGKVVVAKNPCYLLGDVRVLTAIDVKELEHLVDCIVFPTQGERPHPEEIAGSDLDGDQYFVSWDQDLIPSVIHKPYHYPSINAIETNSDITPEVLIDLFASQKNNMGKIDSYYKYWANLKSAGCTECQTLGQLFSRSVDATKTGDIVSIPPNLIPPVLPEKEKKDHVPFVWEIMEDLAVEMKKTLSQEIVLNADLNVTLLTEEFLYSLLDMENRISNITEFQLLTLIFQWCSRYSSSESENQKFKEMAKLISFGELTLEQQVCAIDLGIPLKEVTNALNHSILPHDLVRKFSLDDPYRTWRFYFNSSLADFKWRNLLRGIRNHQESLLVIQLPEEITFVLHFLSKIELGETNLDSDTVVTYFSSNRFNLNLQCALGSDFSIILDEDKLQIYKGKIAATFIWLRKESTPKRTKNTKLQSQDILFDRISVDLTRFKSDVLRKDGHPIVNKQSILSIEVFVKTETNEPAYLDYIDADISSECSVEEEQTIVDDVDSLPPDLTDGQKQSVMLIDQADPKGVNLLAIIAHHGTSGHLYNFSQTLERILSEERQPVFVKQLLVHFNELLSVITFKFCHENISAEVERVFVATFSLFSLKKISHSAIQVLQIISNAAKLGLFQWVESTFVSLLEIIEATEVAQYFDIIGNWELWYHIPSSFAVRLSDHFYSLFLSLCDQSPNIDSEDSTDNIDCDGMIIKQQEVDKYSIHFSRLIHSHLLCEMCDLKEQLGHFCDSASTLVCMRCYKYVSPRENALDHEQESELYSLKIGFNRPSKGIASKAFLVGTFVSISIMIRSKPQLSVCSKPIAIGRIVKVCKQPADIVFELQQPVPDCLRRCLQDGIGHWELTLIGNITLFKRSLSALKEVQTNCISSSLLPLVVNTHQSVHSESYTSREDNMIMPDCTSQRLPTMIISDLNSNQRRAVSKALNHKITLIHGPPGTGKTHVACKIVSEQLARNTKEPILIVAETNMAVDNLCEKLLCRDIRVVRIGKLEQISSAVHRITLEGQIEKKRIQERKDKKASQFLSKSAMKPILKAAQVIATTCTGAGDPCLKGMKFPFVVIDEATQVTEPTSLIPLMYGCQQLTLIGDPQQLAPIIMVKHHSMCKLDELSVTIFHRFRKISSHNSIFLNEQYRMHPKLAEFPSKQFYDGKLSTAKSRHEENSIFQESVPFIDNANPQVFINCHQNEIRLGTSVSNPAEARLVTKIIKTLIDFKISSQQIVVLTPYSGQLKCILSECQTQKINHVRIHTIDSFQGRETDIIIFSSVRCNSAHQLGFLDDQYRINVLLTRARHCVIGIGSVETLTNGSLLWKEWLSTVNVIEASDFSTIKSGISKHKKTPSSGRLSIGPLSPEDASPLEVVGSHSQPTDRYLLRGRRGGRGQRGNHSLVSSDHRQSYHHESRSMRGNRTGRGRAHYKSSYQRQTNQEETMERFAFHERPHSVEESISSQTDCHRYGNENTQHRGSRGRRPFRGRRGRSQS